MSESVQPTLDGVETKPRPGVLQEINTYDLPDGSMNPSPELIASIKSIGVLTPITVIDRSGEDDAYTIISGRRVVMACRELEIPTVPALVFPPEDRDYLMAMSFTANNVRAENAIADLDAVLAMSASGAQLDEIAKHLHVPLALVTRRAKLAELPPELLDGVRLLAIKLRIAERVARLTSEQKARCVDTYRETGTLTSADVKRIVDLTTDDGPEQMEMKAVTKKARKPWRDALEESIISARLAGISYDAFTALASELFASDLDEEDEDF